VSMSFVCRIRLVAVFCFVTSFVLVPVCYSLRKVGYIKIRSYFTETNRTIFKMAFVRHLEFDSFEVWSEDFRYCPKLLRHTKAVFDLDESKPVPVTLFRRFYCGPVCLSLCLSAWFDTECSVAVWTVGFIHCSLLPLCSLSVYHC